MKNTLILLALAFMLSQCSTLEFEQPLPTAGQIAKSLPRSLAGTYLNASDSSEILKQYHQIEFLSSEKAWNYYLQPYLMVSDVDTSKEAFIRHDSLFGLESDTSSPKFVFMIKRMGDRYLAPAKLRYHIELAKGKIILYDEETGVPKAHQLILRKKDNVYYFNMKEENALYWQSTTLQQTAEGIRFDYLSDPNGISHDLPFATRAVTHINAEGNSDTILVARPTDIELEKYRNTKELLKTDYLIKIQK